MSVSQSTPIAQDPTERKMQKKFVLVSLTLISYWVEATPVNLDTLDFDNTDVSDLKYNSKDLEDYLKFLESGDDKGKDKTKKKTSAFKKKNTENKGAKVNYNIEDLKKFFKSLGVKDDGSYDDSEVYGVAEGEALKAVGVKGTENRKYKKGTKTRGFHRVQHKDEYKKDKEFYEDDEVSGDIKKVGAKGFAYDVSGGLGFDKGQFHHVRNKGIYGKKGTSDKGSAEKDYSGYSDSQGYDAYYDSENN
ncbi:uncharacterized protein LOC123701025 [Colias croceus]|uniref:uncharacterized protein LOC123701025 n=1 Tax=Colias crocea TaxID=72248 RepID=UPI001E27A70C|nr:uncharacterized protein LOC123701025 [Colias croceus]